MSLKGLTDNELYKLKLSIGVANRNKKAEIFPLAVLLRFLRT